jgi:hypothetical protein
MTGAERQRLCCRRRKLGRILLTIEVNALVLTELLVAKGVLRASKANDRQGIAAGVEEMLAAHSQPLRPELIELQLAPQRQR